MLTYCADKRDQDTYRKEQEVIRTLCQFALKLAEARRLARKGGSFVFQIVVEHEIGVVAEEYADLVLPRRGNKTRKPRKTRKGDV